MSNWVYSIEIAWETEKNILSRSPALEVPHVWAMEKGQETRTDSLLVIIVCNTPVARHAASKHFIIPISARLTSSFLGFFWKCSWNKMSQKWHNKMEICSWISSLRLMTSVVNCSTVWRSPWFLNLSKSSTNWNWMIIEEVAHVVLENRINDSFEKVEWNFTALESWLSLAMYHTILSIPSPVRTTSSWFWRLPRGLKSEKTCTTNHVPVITAASR